MKTAEDVRKYAAENAIDESDAIERGLTEKAKEYGRAEAGGIDLPQASPQGSGCWGSNRINSSTAEKKFIPNHDK